MEDKIEVLNIIGKNIKQARLLKGFTQEALSEAINKSTNFISLVERGSCGLALSTVVDICNALDVDVSVIFNGLVNIKNTEGTEQIISKLSMFEDADRRMVMDLIDYIIQNKK